MTIQGLATVGTIATFVNYSRRFAAPLRQLADLYNQIQSALAGAERVFDLGRRRRRISVEQGARDAATSGRTITARRFSPSMRRE